MRQHLKLAGTGLTGTLILGWLVMGWDGVASEAAAWRDWLRGQHMQHTSTDTHISAQKAVLRKGAERLRDIKRRSLATQDDVQVCRQAIEKLQAQLKKEQGVLSHVRLKLGAGAETISVGRRSYSRADVECDLRKRLDKCKQWSDRIQTEEQKLARLESAANQSRRLEAEFERDLAAKQTELETMIAEVRNAEAAHELQTEVAEWKSTPLDNSLWDERQQEIKRRIRDVQIHLTAGQDGDLIDWNDTPEDLLGEVDAWLANREQTHE